MSELTDFHKRAIQYVINVGGEGTVKNFDDDHEPIGPQLRAVIVPYYVREEFGRLWATDAGRAAVSAGEGNA